MDSMPVVFSNQRQNGNVNRVMKKATGNAMTQVSNANAVIFNPDCICRPVFPQITLV